MRMWRRAEGEARMPCILAVHAKLRQQTALEARLSFEVLTN